MEILDRTPNGLRVVRRTEYTEDEILNDFSSKIEIKRNGKLVENKVMDMNTTQIIETSENSVSTSSDAPIDPDAFFGSSLNGLLKNVK